MMVFSQYLKRWHSQAVSRVRGTERQVPLTRLCHADAPSLGHVLLQNGQISLMICADLCKLSCDVSLLTLFYNAAYTNIGRRLTCQIS